MFLHILVSLADFNFDLQLREIHHNLFVNLEALLVRANYSRTDVVSLAFVRDWLCLKNADVHVGVLTVSRLVDVRPGLTFSQKHLPLGQICIFSYLF